MKQDIILAGVGGQGILSIAYVIDNAALQQGLKFKQAEVHGMAQRGGAVQSHLRISDGVIHSDLIPRGAVDLILSVEPLEALRYVGSLSPEGTVISSREPFINIPDYPDLDRVLEAVRATQNAVIVDSRALAAEAGSPRAQNIVMLGAASPRLAVTPESLRAQITELFSPKGQKIVDINLKAFELGRAAAQSQG